MSYKFTKGKVDRGDIYNEDDAQQNTYLDWSEDALGVVCGGHTSLVVSGSSVISSSLNLSASGFYGDGSGLSNISATASPAGSDGQIQYNNGGSLGGTANFYWSDSNNRLGIGTSTPSASLEIKHASSAVMQFSCDDGRMYSVGSDGYGFIVHDETTSDVSGYRLVISDRAEYLGYVGIGDGVSLAAQAHPKALLHVSSSDDQALFRVDTTGGSSATTVLFATGSNRVGIGTSSPDYTLDVAGDIGVDQYIYHNGDANTLINFADDKIILKAGGKAMITMEEKGTAPHEVTINDGGNNIDFVVKGNGSNQGNPGMFFDASNNRVGINGVGSPSWELDVDGNIGLSEYIYHRGDDDTYIQFSDDEIVLYAGGRGFLKCQENDSSDKLMVNYGGLALDLQVKGENEANLIRTDAAKDLVGIGTSAPSARLAVSSSHFAGLAFSVTDNHTNYFQISGSSQGSVTSFGVTTAKAVNDAPDASYFISGAVGGKGQYGVTVISGDLQVSGNIYNTLGDGATTIFSPYLAQQILDPSSVAVFAITNSSNTLYKVDWDSGDTSCTDPHVTFTAPPSGQVLVDVHVYLDDTSTSGAGPYIYLALSTSTAANISSTDGTIVGQEKIIWYPDEADDGVRTMTFYATGLTAGTSYTWNLFARRYNDGETNRVICGAQYPAMIMQVRPVMDNADIYSS